LSIFGTARPPGAKEDGSAIRPYHY